jgi:AbrB family looped-hinge helix DNA binding protein
MKISERGQITIPIDLRDRFGLHQGVEVECVPHEGGILIRKRTEGAHPVDRLWGLLGTGESTDDYIREIRGE